MCIPIVCRSKSRLRLGTADRDDLGTGDRDRLGIREALDIKQGRLILFGIREALTMRKICEVMRLRTLDTPCRRPGTRKAFQDDIKTAHLDCRPGERIDLRSHASDSDLARAGGGSQSAD